MIISILKALTADAAERGVVEHGAVAEALPERERCQADPEELAHENNTRCEHTAR